MNNLSSSRFSSIPQFWWLLSDEDRCKYTCLKIAISSRSLKSQRNKRVETFNEILSEIQSFVVRGTKDDAVRGLACGVFWLAEGIAINTHQLRHLISKCKSSINGSLQKMGYSTSLGRTEAAIAISNAFPILKDNSTELRKWTVRKMTKNMCFEAIDSSSPAEHHSSTKNKGCFTISLAGIKRNNDYTNRLVQPKIQVLQSADNEFSQSFIPELKYDQGLELNLDDPNDFWLLNEIEQNDLSLFSNEERHELGF